MDKVELSESEQREVDMITEEFKARGGMSDEELISRFGAIPFEEFSNEMKEKIRNYKRYKRPDSEAFAQKVSQKIKGWYAEDTYHDRAVERIVHQREEICSLLEKVEKVSVNSLLKYLDSSGFFYRPSAPNRHHNFPGGLAEHSLGVYRIVEEWNKMTSDERRQSELYNRFLQDKDDVSCDIFTEKMNTDDMIIASICHDLCKADHYYFDGRIIKRHHRKPDESGHSWVSKKRLEDNGIKGAECEELLLAVQNHMKLFSHTTNLTDAVTRKRGRASMLAIAVWAADKADASAHPAGKLHREF